MTKKKLSGIPASRGVAIAKAYVMVQPQLDVVKKDIQNVEEEIARLNAAITKANDELTQIKDKFFQEKNQEHAQIFEAHLTILHDEEFTGAVRGKVQAEKICAEYALETIVDNLVLMFESMDDQYMRERAADIKDISRRITAHLLEVPLINLSLINEEVVIIAEDLTPSDTAQLNKKYVRAFVTNIGGRTSHSAIMARSMEIPAVVGTEIATTEIKHNDLIIVDGIDATVILNPSDEEIAHYEKKHIEYVKKKEEWTKFIDKKSVTSDGYATQIAANIGSPSDLASVINNGAEGVGLYRTEFLYMESDVAPSEEIQFLAYKTVLEGVNNHPVVVRTLDVGGDKNLSYLPMPEELNPFLGQRAIRLCLDRESLFRTQLSALLRASIYGNLKIMFPMIATLEEFRKCKQLLLEEKARLKAEGFAVSDDIEVGIMIEIPSAALIADQFAKEVDFFSIGTNDLIQYTMAADRMNKSVAYLYQPYHPAIIRFIKMVIDAAHKENKWVGMCGELAGEELAVLLLFGLGLDEFSMSSSSVLRARATLSRYTKAELQAIANEALTLSSEKEIIALLQAKLTQV